MAPTQDGRVMRVDSPLGKDVLLLELFTGTESISSPFSFDVSVLATRAVKADELLEKPLTLTITHPMETRERIIHGLVRSLTAMGREGGFYSYQVQMVPWVWFLSLYRDCRLFQQMTVKDIVAKVFSDRGFSDYRVDCKGQFATREFTVQYNETDLEFVSRLLEEEGIFYFFEHTKDKHTLVLADHQGALEPSPIQKDVKVQRSLQGLAAEGVIESVYVESAIHTGAVTLDDYNYEKPTSDLSVAVKGERKFEHYDYPGVYGEPKDGQRIAEIRVEEEEAHAATLQAFGNSIGFIPGYRFNLSESDEHDAEYLVLEVTHHSGTLDYSSAEAEKPDYRSGLTAVPYATPYRPPRRTPRPVIHGAQTAVVVGPSSEEIYTDKYGRVKVLFHWDRLSKKDGESSCWIRVASTWAGNKWGAIQIPRVGQEVVVEFLEGNPDRPIITGSVWNAQQMPVFDAKPTQSGWKSRSSKGGAARSNEFRWEDKKGEEEIYLHAEKDMNFAVVNNHTETVDVDHVVTIGNDETITIQNNQTVEIEKDQSITLKSGDRTIELQAGDLVTKLAAGEITYEAAKSITFKVGSSSIKIEPTAITMSSLDVKIEGQIGVEVAGLQVKVDADTTLDLKAGINATLEGGVGATVKGGVMAEVKGTMVQVDGSGMLAAKGGITMIG